MRLIQWCGFALFVLVLAAGGVDIWKAATTDGPHPVVTGTHLGFLLVALFALSLTSNAVLDNLGRFTGALRGLRRSGTHRSP